MGDEVGASTGLIQSRYGWTTPKCVHFLTTGMDVYLQSSGSWLSEENWYGDLTLKISCAVCKFPQLHKQIKSNI